MKAINLLHILGCWIKSRKWQLLFCALLVGNIIVVKKAYKVYRKEMTAMRTENQQMFAEFNTKVYDEIKALKIRVDELGEMPLAYAETPKGLAIVPANRGVSRAEIDFLARYRGAIFSEKTNVEAFPPGKLIEALKTELDEGFKQDERNLQLRSGSERESLIAYTMLRTNGSMPTYEVRDTVPNNLDQLVLGTSGNCTDFTFRLMMLLESIGLKASTISSNTKNLGGHVFVDAYDSEQDKAYLLDANFNVMIVLPNSKGRGFLESVFAMKPEERKTFAGKTDISAFPVYFRFLDPGKTGLTLTPLTPEFINEQRADREPMWRRWLAKDTEELLKWWNRAPIHAPRTLKEFSKVLSAIPGEFDVSDDYAARLRKVADLKIETL